MDHIANPDIGADKSRVMARAEQLLSDEVCAGSDDPERQAARILAESDDRLTDRVAPTNRPIERRKSEETVDLVDVSEEADEATPTPVPVPSPPVPDRPQPLPPLDPEPAPEPPHTVRRVRP